MDGWVEGRLMIYQRNGSLGLFIVTQILIIDEELEDMGRGF